MPQVELLVDPAIASSQIQEALTTATALLELSSRTEADLAEFRTQYLSWTERTEAVLESCFETHGAFTSGPSDEFRRVGLGLLDLRISNTSVPAERVNEVQRDIQEKSRILRSIQSRLDVYAWSHRSSPSALPVSSKDESIFLIHGHNLLIREKVRMFAEKVTSRPVVVLDEQPNKGRDILGKLLDHALLASFAIVLLTGDDVGRAIEADEWQRRARQNVILELGLFLGLLGRNKVVALYEDGVEMPSDYQGVLWVPLSDEGWTLRLAREMKGAGIAVDLNAAI